MGRKGLSGWIERWHDAVDNEGGHQLIDVPDAAQRPDAELPCEDHQTAGHQTCQHTLPVAASPEKREQHGGAKGCAETGPCEGDDLEHVAVGVRRQEDGDKRDHHHRQTGGQHILLGSQLDAEHILQYVFRKRGGRRQKLRVRRGHGSRQNARQNAAGHNGRQQTVRGKQVRQPDNDRLRGAALQHGDAAHTGHGMAHDANKHSHGHGDHHPDGSDPAGELQLILVPDGHKAHQNVGHAEVAKAPGQHGNNADQTVRLRLAGGGVIGLTKAQKTGSRAPLLSHTVSLDSACIIFYLAFSTICTNLHLFVLLKGRVSMISTVSPTLASFFSS